MGEPIESVPVLLHCEQFAVLLPDGPAMSPTHPLRCHRTRIPDRTVFEQVVAPLAHGSGCEQIVTAGCSDRTIRHRLHEWATSAELF